MIHRNQYTTHSLNQQNQSKYDSPTQAEALSAEQRRGLSLVSEAESFKDYLEEAQRVFGSYGLEVLQANDSRVPSQQHGWKEIYIRPEEINIPKRYKAIEGIRKRAKRIESRIWLFEHNVIDEYDIYAHFYDLHWRQNNLTWKGQEDFHGRWNNKRPFGYQVRKRLRGVLEQVEHPKMLTLTVSIEISSFQIHKSRPCNVLDSQYRKVG